MPGRKLPRIEGAPVIIDPRPIEEIEREVFLRFTGGHNFLGWHAAGRDEDGYAVMQCVHEVTRNDEKKKRIARVLITKEGLVYMRDVFVDA